jgi:hypothetical protein
MRLGRNSGFKHFNKGNTKLRHTDEFKQQLRERLTKSNPAARPVKATFPNGHEHIFDTIKNCAKNFDISPLWVKRIIDERLDVEGVRLEYVEASSN